MTDKLEHYYQVGDYVMPITRKGCADLNPYHWNMALFNPWYVGRYYKIKSCGVKNGKRYYVLKCGTFYGECLISKAEYSIRKQSQRYQIAKMKKKAEVDPDFFMKLL